MIPSRPAQHVFLAFTNPVAERDVAFNAWYDDAHVPQLLRYGRGFAGGRRYRLQSSEGAGDVRPWNYLALYVLENDDPASLSEGWLIDGAPRLTPFSGLLHDDHAGWIYTPTTPRLTRDPGRDVSSPYSAGYLSLDWSRETHPNFARHLQDSLTNTQICEAATAFVLADGQRANQLASPWGGLVIRELRTLEGGVPLACDARWCFAGLRPYVSREQVVGSRFAGDSR